MWLTGPAALRAACGILPDQGSNPCPLHWQADSQPLRHQGSPYSCFISDYLVLYVVVSIHPFLPLPICPLFHPFLPSTIHLPIYLFIHSSTYPPTRVSTYPSIYLSTHPSMHSSIHPSIHPTAFHVTDSILGAEHPMTHHLHIISHTQSDFPLPLCPSKSSPALIPNSTPSSPLKTSLTMFIQMNSV